MDWNDLDVIDVNENIKSMSRDQLVELFSYKDRRAKKFGEVNGRKLIRNIIYQQWQYCQQEVREYKTIRQFWYSYVKPVISEAGLLDAKTEWDDVLSEELGAIVKDYKLCRYADLYIRDKSRMRIIATGRHYPRIILFVEKEGTFGDIENIPKLYGITAITGKGQPSIASVEDLIIELKKVTSLKKRFMVFTLTDYDPAGYIIENAFLDHLTELGIPEITHYRVGMIPELLTEREREINKYEVKSGDKKTRKINNDWLDATGGIDGELYGLEIECLEPMDVRRIFIERLSEVIDEEPYFDDLRDRLVNEKAQEAVWGITRKFESQLALALREEITSQDKDYSDRIQFESESYHKQAVEGKSYYAISHDTQEILTEIFLTFRDFLTQKIESGEIVFDVSA